MRDKKSNLFEKIIQISEYYGYNSINDFSINGLGYTSSEKINRLKDPNKKPSIDIINDISNKFEINLNWLLNDIGEMVIGQKPNVQKKLYNKSITQSITESITNEKYKKGYTIGEKSTTSYLSAKKIEHKVPQVVTITPQQEDNIVLVPVAAQAGYLLGYDDPTFMEELPTYNLPNIRNGIFRMFQVSGLSMYPTLQNGSYVVGQFVEDWLNLSDNRVYVVVTQEHGVIVKRVLNRIAKYGSLYCKSDNREYPNISVAPEDIKEIWECKMHLSYEFLDPATVYNKLSDLEADVMHLTERLNRYEENQ